MTGGRRIKRITTGAAQGSILGPDVWNVLYDGKLHTELLQDACLRYVTQMIQQL